ncbi:DUF4238 domain-containing protein [Rhizobium sp. VS19-DR104.2]|uniref:DUF4238 domain-containing protein n=1 Tax=unclassified Rhizobium TaxID=2613769 RepID=UPI001C5B7470|nr:MULTISPECIES: DUF4238 domain-containing protein [unclassified Rhizobium]MBZ5763574.1 DUF4238 domain-containing protein [Rhizobium sp. VS19-DR96]MBZ5769501.1 DUF4238 domain-containing protein [Rhizobium sp. VS19-DR129.2]MBZ5777079.1 DUF4238 domain-containing protein [Rhizobium sp. VS19-DRK62.2]MBZ5788211.1 DUF4238 domain-containing protein [Rhizobium sp. VS19-DR121]MBZ5805648.1 DUF4238 domain-containing protein [Rhizobium sp. VS19-DR181]
MPDNEPIYHHYIPQFYLRRWANKGRKVCRFSKPYDRILPKMTAISGTGGMDRLYEMKTVSPEFAQWFEKGSLKAIDTAANNVLDLLEAGKLDHLTSDQRSMWARFLMSMLMRGPRDIEVMQASYAQEWQALIPEIVAEFKASENEITRGLAANVPAMLAPGSPLLADWGLEAAIGLMDHAGIGNIIINMEWIVRDMPESAPELLTSDRPIMKSGELVASDDFVMLPIGPRTLFIAVGNAETVGRVQAYDPAAQAAAVNRFIVERAQECVYGTDDAQLEFVREYMGTKPIKTLFERLVAFRERNGTPL